MVKAICAALDKMQPSLYGPRERLITFVADRPWHDRRYVIDASNRQRKLGWSAAETFETALGKTVQRYLNNRRWWQSILDRGYRAERVGQGERDI